MKLTGSGFARAEKCAPSTFLPSVQEPSSIYAAAGIAVHRFLCAAMELGPERALEQVDEEHRATCSAIDFDSLPHSSPDNWAAEVAFAWSPEFDTARELHRGNGSRDYQLAADEIAGTADLIGLDGDRVVVLDVKTGWAPLGPPSESTQLGFYAVAAARAYGARRAVVGWVRLANGTPRYEHAELDEIDLDAMAERLRTIAVNARFAEAEHQSNGALKLTTGEHCAHCASFLSCPAKISLARELAVSDGQLLPDTLDAESVPKVLERLWAIQEVLEKVESTLKEYAAAYPVKLSDGRIYGMVEQTTETFDPIIGLNALRKLRGEAFADACVELKTSLTKASIERVIKATMETGEKFAPIQRETFEALRSAGAAKLSKYSTLKVFKPNALKEGK